MMAAIALALVIATLTAAAAAVTQRGRQLFVVLFVLSAGVGAFNQLIEAVVFEVMPLQAAAWNLAGLTAVAAVSSGIAVAISRVLPSPAPRHSQIAFTRARVLAIAACYVVLYFVAGMLIFPKVKHFYEGKALPSLSTLIPLQLARGTLYALYALPWLKLGPAWPGLILGLAFSILGGVAPLLVDDNPYLPAGVRHWHLLEIGVSNFLFGLIVGRLLTRRKPGSERMR